MSERITAGQMLAEKIRKMGGDGLYCDYISCGCGLDDFQPCDGVNLDHCELAKKHGDFFYPIDINPDEVMNRKPCPDPSNGVTK